jgi:hypothetical protein
MDTDVLAVQLLPLALAVRALTAKPVTKPTAARQPTAVMTVTRLVPRIIIASGEVRSPSSIRKNNDLTRVTGKSFVGFSASRFSCGLGLVTCG